MKTQRRLSALGLLCLILVGGCGSGKKSTTTGTPGGASYLTFRLPISTRNFSGVRSVALSTTEKALISGTLAGTFPAPNSQFTVRKEIELTLPSGSTAPTTITIDQLTFSANADDHNGHFKQLIHQVPLPTTFTLMGVAAAPYKPETGKTVYSYAAASDINVPSSTFSATDWSELAGVCTQSGTTALTLSVTGLLASGTGLTGGTISKLQIDYQLP